MAVRRFALRGWDAESPTRTIGRSAIARAICSAADRAPLVAAAARAALRGAAPVRARAAAWPCDWPGGSERRWPYHLVYLAEACLLRDWLRQSASGTCTRISAPTRPKSRCSLMPSAARPTASRCTGRRSSTSPQRCTSREKIAQRVVRRRHQLVRAQPAVSLGRPGDWPHDRGRALRRRRRLPRAASTATAAASPARWSASAGCASRRASCCWSRRWPPWSAGASRSSSCSPATARCVARSRRRIDGSACGTRCASPAGSAARRCASEIAGGARAGAAELCRRSAGRHHGSDGAGPARDHDLHRRHPGAGRDGRKRAGSFRPAMSTRSPPRCEACLDAPDDVLARMGAAARAARARAARRRSRGRSTRARCSRVGADAHALNDSAR